MDNSYLDARTQLANELNDPEVAQQLFELTHNEVGGQGPEAQQAFLETVFNRAAARNKDIKDIINDHRYYPNVSFRPVSADPTIHYATALHNVLHGSNISNGATGNASGSVGFGGGPMTASFGGEKFGIEKADTGASGIPSVDSGRMAYSQEPPVPMAPMDIPDVTIPDASSITPDIVNQAIQSQPASAQLASTDEPTAASMEALAADNESDTATEAETPETPAGETTQELVHPPVPIEGKPRIVSRDGRFVNFDNGMFLDTAFNTYGKTDKAGNMYEADPVTGQFKQIKKADTKQANIKTNPVDGQMYDLSDPANPKLINFPDPLQGKEATQEDFNKLSWADQQKAKDYSSYHLTLSPYGMARDKTFQRLYPYIKLMNPAYDWTKSQARATVQKQYMNQAQTQPGGQIQSFNRALTHIATMDDLANQLNNINFRKYNSIANFMASEAGKSFRNNYDYAAGIVSTEMARAYKNGVPDDADIKRQRVSLDSANSPAQLHDVLRKSAIPLIEGALENLKSGFEEGMDEPFPNHRLILPPARTALDKLGYKHFAGVDLTGRGQASSAPGPVTHSDAYDEAKRIIATSTDQNEVDKANAVIASLRARGMIPEGE